MEDQVALYLFRHRRCVLPGIGELKVHQKTAVYSGVQENIAAPFPYIDFENNEEASDNDLSSFISFRNNISQRSAELYVHQLVEKLKGIHADESVEIPSAGKFVVNEEGVLQFLSYALPKEMLPIVSAKTLLRTSDHAILVGDTESNATRMTAYYSEQNIKKRAWWKIAAAILFITVVAYLVYYFVYQHQTGGNIQKITIHNEPATYSVP